QGQLITVRGGVIEFEERRGYGSGRTVRLNRNEVVRIEIDDNSGDHYNRRGAYTPGGDYNSGRPPAGLRERQTTVAANVPWNDTRIEGRGRPAGYFEPRGEIRWGRDRRDGPEGEKTSPNNPNRPIPSRPAGALIGRVGNGNDFFFIGAANGPGRLPAH